MWVWFCSCFARWWVVVLAPRFPATGFVVGYNMAVVILCLWWVFDRVSLWLCGLRFCVSFLYVVVVVGGCLVAWLLVVLFGVLFASCLCG